MACGFGTGFDSPCISLNFHLAKTGVSQNGPSLKRFCFCFFGIAGFSVFQGTVLFCKSWDFNASIAILSAILASCTAANFFKPAVNRRAKKIQPEVKNLDQHIMFDCPDILREFLFYLETIQGRSPKTVNGYYIELRTFLRYLKSVKVLKSCRRMPRSLRRSRSTTSPRSWSAR